MTNFESIIRYYVPLPTKTSPSGWYVLRCPVCNDHYNKKRGGWKFENTKIMYHCFNCSIAAVYDEDTKYLSSNMEKVLLSFKIPENVIERLKFLSFENRKNWKTKSNSNDDTHPIFKEPKPIVLPKHFYRLTDDKDDIWSQIAREYLNLRGIDINDYHFYLSTGGTTAEEQQWKKRLIIPIYKNEKLIFYQGRDLTGNNKTKYLSAPSVSKGSVIYGFDFLYKHTNQPLFITEGFFDAFHIDGVAVFGNKMSRQQIEYLKLSPRQKVIVPDRKGNGHLLAIQGLQQGWNVSVLPFDDCKDVDEAVSKYGKLYVIQTLLENIVSGFEAEVRINLLCEK